MSSRIRSLDGARGVAILLVVVLHYFSKPALGWVGVDLFFVLSGYLITSILMKEREDRYFWRKFYTRRIVRLLPAYCVLLVGAALLTPLPWARIWYFFIFFIANFAYPVVGRPGMGVLIVLWSLAVEEHYYLFWPLFARKLSPQTLKGLLLGVILLEPFVRVFSMRFVHDFFIFYSLTPFRLDGLAMGSLLALCLLDPKLREKLSRTVTFAFPLAVCLFVLCFIVAHYTREDNGLFMNAFGYTLIAFTFACMLLWLLERPASRLTRAFEFAPLRFLGTISYSLYLYHLLIQNVAHVLCEHFRWPHPILANVTGALASVGVAYLSFKYMESPILTWGRTYLRNLDLRSEPFKVQLPAVDPPTRISGLGETSDERHAA